MENPCHRNRYSTVVYRISGITFHAEVSHQDFQKCLYNQFNKQEIVHERDIQKAYKNLISPLGNGKNLIKDGGEAQEALDELNAYLSD